jgi:hypothetical protein
VDRLKVDRLKVNKLKADGKRLFLYFSLQPKYLPTIFVPALPDYRRQVRPVLSLAERSKVI